MEYLILILLLITFIFIIDKRIANMQVNLPQYLTVKLPNGSVITEKFKMSGNTETTETTETTVPKTKTEPIELIKPAKSLLSKLLSLTSKDMQPLDIIGGSTAKDNSIIFNTDTNIGLKKTDDISHMCREYSPDTRKIDKSDYNSRTYFVKDRSINMDKVHPMNNSPAEGPAKEPLNQSNPANPILSDSTYYKDPNTMTETQRQKFKSKAKISKMTIQDYKNWLLLHKDNPNALSVLEQQHLQVLINDNYLSPNALYEAQSSIVKSSETTDNQILNQEIDDYEYYDPKNADVLYDNYLQTCITKHCQTTKQALEEQPKTTLVPDAYNADDITEIGQGFKPYKHLNIYSNNCKSQYGQTVLENLKGQPSNLN